MATNSQSDKKCLHGIDEMCANCDPLVVDRCDDLPPFSADRIAGRYRWPEAALSTTQLTTGDEVTLEECEAGLFTYNGNLCFKSEYGDNNGVLDCYIVSSGEFFCGPTSNAWERRKLKVRPVQVWSSPSAPSAIAPKFEEKPTAWMIERPIGSGKEIARELVFSPLTDDVYMDEGDMAWPLFRRSDGSAAKP